MNPRVRGFKERLANRGQINRLLDAVLRDCGFSPAEIAARAPNAQI